MATELAQAYVQIIPSMKGIKQNITSELEPAAESAGTSAGNKIGGFIRKAIAAAGIGTAIKSALNEGAALEQSIGGVETLFKDAASTVKQYANEAYKTAGLSANAYMEQVTSFSASLLQSLGGDTSAAAEVANQAMVDMSDNANKMGTDMVSIQNAYQGFAKQNYTMLDNLKLGYGGTKSEMERLLADAQELTGVEFNIDNLSDVYNAIHVIQGELGITGTTAQEAEQTFSGSFAAMKAAAQNLLASLANGNDLTNVLSELETSVITFGQNLLPMLKHILSAIPTALVDIFISLAPTLVTTISETITEMIGAITQQMPALIPAFVQCVTNIISALVAALPQLVACGSDLLMAIVDGLVAAIPILVAAIPSIVSQLVAALPALVQSIVDALVTCLPQLVEGAYQLILGITMALPDILLQLIDVLPTLIDSIVTGILDCLPQLIEAQVQIVFAMIQALPEIIAKLVVAVVNYVLNLVVTIINLRDKFKEAAKEWITRMWTGITENWSTFVSNVKTWFAKIPQTISNAFSNISSVGVNLVKGLWNGISNVTSWIIGKIRGFGRSVMNGIKSIFGIHSPSTEMAWVGKMLDYGLAEGIEGNTRPISGAIDEVTGLTTGTLDSNLAVNAALGVSTDADATGLLGQLLSAVQSLESRIDGMQVVLDSGELVGGIATKMDSTLGKRNSLIARGVTA